MGKGVEISIHHPSPYILANRERILPDWKNQSSFWVVIVLQQSDYPLLEKTLEIEAEKELLREKFMRFACDVVFNLRDGGYLTDLFDPRTGYPLLSRPGEIPHDDTAVVKALLNYPIICNQCRVLIHPQWGPAVYPSVLVSAAPLIKISSILRHTSLLHEWTEVIPGLTRNNEFLSF
jgi:hypothetical protein